MAGNQASILIVEDEPSIAEVVSLYLRRAGYQVQVLGDGEAALASLERQMPDLLILDLMLPGVDGIEITRWLRERNDVPIIMLTARRAETDRIAGLELGADDYVIKPFSPQELVSRVRAVLRRTQTTASGSDANPLEVGDLKIDPVTRLVTVRGNEITLTAKEYEMLWLLACHPRQVFSREQLQERVWGFAQYMDPNNATVLVRRLREKIEVDPSHPDHLITVWGVGYKFEP